MCHIIINVLVKGWLVNLIRNVHTGFVIIQSKHPYEYIGQAVGEQESVEW